MLLTSWLADPKSYHNPWDLASAAGSHGYLPAIMWWSKYLHHIARYVPGCWTIASDIQTVRIAISVLGCVSPNQAAGAVEPIRNALTEGGKTSATDRAAIRLQPTSAPSLEID
jgi:hypothetical protein